MVYFYDITNGKIKEVIVKAWHFKKSRVILILTLITGVSGILIWQLLPDFLCARSLRRYDEPMRRALAGELSFEQLLEKKRLCPISGGEYFCVVIRGGDGDWWIAGDAMSHPDKGLFPYGRHYNMRYCRPGESPQDLVLPNHAIDLFSRLVATCEIVWFSGPGLPLFRGRLLCYMGGEDATGDRTIGEFGEEFKYPGVMVPGDQGGSGS